MRFKRQFFPSLNWFSHLFFLSFFLFFLGQAFSYGRSPTVLCWFHDHSLFGFNNISFSFCGIPFVGTFKKSAIFSRNLKKRKLMDILFCSWFQAWNSWWGWLVTQWWYWVLAPRRQAKNHWPVCIIFSHVPPTLSKVLLWVLKSDPSTENLPCVFPEVLPWII
jgi:hypothetical protein